MSRIGKIARRTFLVGAVAVAGGVAFGVWAVRKPAPNPLRPADGETALSPFVVIDAEGVTLVAPRAEMGQGVHTTWAALIAEELDVDWQEIRVIHGPAATAYYNHAMLAEGLPNKGYDASAFQEALGETLGGVGKLLDLQVTGGSTSMKDGFERMRVAGAAARETLKLAAAERLGVAAATLSTEAGAVVTADGTRLPYAELAEAAAGIDPPNVILRDPADWRYLGQTLPRVDMVGKATGTAEFAIDIRLPGMKFASVRMNPHLGGGMRSYDSRDAEKMAGVLRVVDLGEGVAVIAENTWLAMKALEAIDIDWEPAAYPADMDGLRAAVSEGFETSPNSTMRNDGDAGALPEGAQEITAEYEVPYLAHATMEPMNATALITADGLELWSGNQAPTFVQAACAEAAGLSADRVTVHTPYMGGGFGRRGELDFSVLATRVAMALPGTPVQTTWSREEDMTHDFYRPLAMARMRGAVRDGTAVLLDAQVSAPSTSQQALNRWVGFAPGGPDKVHVEGLFNQPYGIANYRVRGYLADLSVPIGFWRSVGNSYNGFFHESFVDEMAHAAGADPLEFRLALTRDEYEPAWECLRAVQEMSGWNGETPQGVGRGVALCYSFGTPVAQVIEVTDEDGAIRIAKAWIACDVGTALDPGNVEAQMSGGLIYGLSAAVMGEITFAEGRVEQRNFPDYDALRMHTTPEIAVRVLTGGGKLGGVGEPGTPPAAPALANAVFDLTGQRARTLPLAKQFKFIT